MELGPNQKKWVAALRSGEYKQSRDGCLEWQGKFCCLGVGAKISGIPFHGGELRG